MIWELDATGLVAAYRSGEADPVTAVRELRDRIRQIDPVLNTFVALNEQAEDEAANSARRLRAGAPRGPLEGVPLAVKDNLVVAGIPAAWGSRVFADKLCAEDELPIRRLREAGAIVLGKTNTPEFAVEGYTANALFGVTRNPWNPELTPGGSSGGSVAAVAAGLAPAAIGTDGGGSIRRPAAYTGLFGLKPTTGRVARNGGLPQVLLDFEVVGPLTRSARDLRLIYAALAGPDRVDPRSRGVPGAQTRDRPLRILYVETFGDAPCDPAIRGSVGAAADRLATLGHSVERGALPFSLDALNAFWGKVAQVGLARMREVVPGMAEKARPQYLAMADEGEKVSAREFVAGLECVQALRSDVSRAFADWDVIMTPACAAQPWAADVAYPETIDGQPVGPRGHAIYTGWVNACGHPAVAVPGDPAPDGMPIGFQLVGDLGAEDLLLDLAEAHEVTVGGKTVWPDVALG